MLSFQVDIFPLNSYRKSRDRIVVSTLRCGRNNPGSNPGHGKRRNVFRFLEFVFILVSIENNSYNCILGLDKILKGDLDHDCSPYSYITIYI